MAYYDQHLVVLDSHGSGIQEGLSWLVLLFGVVAAIKAPWLHSAGGRGSFVGMTRRLSSSWHCPPSLQVASYVVDC